MTWRRTKRQFEAEETSVLNWRIGYIGFDKVQSL
jgi:hypothetical protein